MKNLTLILNRVHCLLLKINNQSPYFGSIIIVSLLFNTIVNNFLLLLYVFRNEPFIINNIFYCINWSLITIVIFLYAKRKKSKIVLIKIENSKLKNFYVLTLFILTIVIYIYLSNINRGKIFEHKQNNYNIQNTSLESKLRKWFED